MTLRHRRIPLVGAILVVIVGASAMAWASSRDTPSATSVAPVLNRPAQPADSLPAGARVNGPDGALEPSTARRVVQASGVDAWVLQDVNGQLCDVVKIAAQSNEMRVGCSPPSMVSSHAFRSLGISMVSTSPTARPWLGVVEGLVRGDVVAVSVTFGDGHTQQVAPNASGGFVVDDSKSGSSEPPTLVTALAADGSQLESYAIG